MFWNKIYQTKMCWKFTTLKKVQPHVLTCFVYWWALWHWINICVYLKYRTVRPWRLRAYANHSKRIYFSMTYNNNNNTYDMLKKRSIKTCSVFIPLLYNNNYYSSHEILWLHVLYCIKNRKKGFENVQNANREGIYRT